MVDNLINNYPSVVHWIPMALFGFWTHQIFIWMGESEFRWEIISKIEIEMEKKLMNNKLEDLNEESENTRALVADNGKWLYLWLIGSGFILATRFVVVYWLV
jgi:hypothetical protein